MAYKFEAKPYFQPAHFGPWPVEPVLHYGDLTAMAIYYVTDKGALASMLPPGFEVPDVPSVNPEISKWMLSRSIPLAHSAEPEEIAIGALYLASEAASYVTGHTLVIDGGMLA
jgi:NAD(P)-dependent dehydrogenase (short-subunit alcohol dehydrogenase family)